MLIWGIDIAIGATLQHLFEQQHAHMPPQHPLLSSQQHYSKGQLKS